MQEYKPETVPSLPPAAVVMLQRLEAARPFVPMLARPLVNPLLAAFAAYVASTEGQLRELRARADANAQRVDAIEARK